MTNMYRRALLVGGAMLATLPAGAYAQESTETERVGSGISDIVVTARRRAESQQSVPVAITAITSETLREKAITTPYDLTNSTPGISATTGSSQRNDVLYFIRGQGATFGSPPSVVTYFADVPQQTNSASGGSNITFYDLESVQVLKGPQGTLFGRSTTGGAVLLTPKRPTDEFDGFAEAVFGNRSTREFTAAINVPILGDRLAVRVAGNYSYHDGWAKSLTTGQDLDDRDRSSYRITLLAKPTDWLTNTTIFSDVNIKENGTAAVLGNYEPNGLARRVVDPRLPGGSFVTGSLLDTRAGTLYDPTGTVPGSTTDINLAGGLGYITVGQICGAIGGLYAGGFAQCQTERLALINGVRASLDSEAARLAAGGSKRRLATTRPNFIRSQVQQVINTTEIDLGALGFLGDTSFKNIFSTTRNLHSEAVREIQGGVGTGVVYNDVNVTNPNCSATLCTGLVNVQDYGAGKNKWFDVWSEEAQLSGQFNGKHDWIVGYFTERSKSNQYLNKPAVFQTLGGAFTTIRAGLPGISTGYNDGYKTSQTGYFAQGTIDFADFGLDGLRLTGGYRHSIVKQQLIAVNAILNPATGLSPSAAPGIAASVTQKADSYTFSLDYKISPGVMVYAASRRGFKQGGINIQSVVPAQSPIPEVAAAAQPTFAPEKVTDYELGVKADYELGAIGMRTNVAVFQADFSGLHRATSFFNGATTSNQITNAAKLRSRGLELEQIFSFTPAFTVNLAYAYLDAKLRSYPGVIVRPSDGAVIERINTPVTGAPKHKLDVAARYAIDAGDTGDFVLAGNVSYQSRTSISDDALFSLSPEEQKGYAVANLRLDWNNVMDNPVDLSLFVKNLFDKTYRIGSGNLISSQLGTTTYIYSDPRIVGVQVRARFGASAQR